MSEHIYQGPLTGNSKPPFISHHLLILTWRRRLLFVWNISAIGTLQDFVLNFAHYEMKGCIDSWKMQNWPWANVLKLFPLNFKALYLLVQWEHLREGKDFCDVLFLRLLVFMATSCNAFGVRTLLALKITTSILSLFLKWVSNHAWAKTWCWWKRSKIMIIDLDED